jgi:hypothetical protein
MMYLGYVPLATFAVVALLVSAVLACVSFAEGRRRHLHLQRRLRRFRPTVIQGGKLENPEATLPIADAKSGRSEVRLSVLP